MLVKKHRTNYYYYFFNQNEKEKQYSSIKKNIRYYIR